MTAKILDGKELANKIKQQLIIKISELNNKGIFPSLAVILVGDDDASQIYVNSKEKACDEVGIKSYKYILPINTTQTELLNLIDKLNVDEKVNGILVQLPLPSHINEQKILSSINIYKDVDAFHPINIGKIVTGSPEFLPCTPAGVMELIKETGVDIAGKECVVVGRSNIVGKPQAMLLLSQNGTVTICHSKTKDLKEVCKRADILVVAVGKSNLITGDMIKSGAIVIDVGMNRMDNKKIMGDVEFESASNVASFISKVPGGVGPMTIAMLLKNTIRATEIQMEQMRV